MRQVDFEVKFKQEMSNIEIEGVASIVYHVQKEGIIHGDAHAGNFVYTSSSSYAMMGIDTLSYLPDGAEQVLEVSHFAITENNMLIMVCEDGDENHILFEIEPSEF